MDEKSVPNTVPEQSIKPPLNPKEKEAIIRWKAKEKDRNSSIRFKVKEEAQDSFGFDLDSPRGTVEEIRDLFLASVCEATGTKTLDFASAIFVGCVAATNTSSSKSSNNDTVAFYNKILDALKAMHPQDEYEGMLISRLIALHFQGMHFLSQTIQAIGDKADMYVNRSTKLMRLFNETLDTLMRYRRKGEQKMTVQHVQVNEGGQAIVTGQMSAGMTGQK